MLRNLKCQNKALSTTACKVNALAFGNLNFHLHEESFILAERTQSVLSARRKATQRCVLC
jgi:hypothetical protein